MSDEYGFAAKEYGGYAMPPGAMLSSESRSVYAPLFRRVHAGDVCEPDIIDDRILIP